MQSTSATNTPVHIKAQSGDEYRRFSISDNTYAALESILRSLFGVPAEVSIKVKFLDDEKDWILISSDLEFQHALEISTSPIRITLQIGDATKQPEQEAPKVEESFRRRGCGRGMGRGGCGRGGLLSKQERLARKSVKISGRISALETTLLDPALPSERVRAITWKLDKLKSKLEHIETVKTSIAADPQAAEEPRMHWRRGPGCEGEPGQEATGVPPMCGGHWRGRGRGGRCRGRSEEQDSEATECEGPRWTPAQREAWAHFQECRENLKAARRSGDAEAIKVAFEALEKAKEQKKEARFPKA